MSPVPWIREELDCIPSELPLYFGDRLTYFLNSIGSQVDYIQGLPLPDADDLDDEML